MSVNVSTAVRQRRVEPHDSLDDFPTPPWATRALCEWLAGVYPVPLSRRIARDPAANRGHMVEPLREYFGHVEASDVFDYGVGFPVEDFLGMASPAPVDFTISNPPFKLGEDFVRRAIDTSRAGCAMLVRSAFTEGVGRYQRLFSIHRPAAILQFTERVVIHRGKLSPDGTTATAYCWVVWFTGVNGPTQYDWIPPCRKRLERAEDYRRYV